MAVPRFALKYFEEKLASAELQTECARQSFIPRLEMKELSAKFVRSETNLELNHQSTVLDW